MQLCKLFIATFLGAWTVVNPLAELNSKNTYV